MAIHAKKTRVESPVLSERAEAERGKQKRLNVDLDEDVYRAFAVLAAQKGIKMAPLVREWINEYVVKHSNDERRK